MKPLINQLAGVNSKTPLHLCMILSTGSQGNVRPEAVLKQMYGESADLLKNQKREIVCRKKGEFCSPLD